MKRILWLLCIDALLLSSWTGLRDPVTSLELDLRRDFGYGMGRDIQGRFTLSATGPDDLEQVTFLMDDEVLSVDDEEPFRYSFSTGDFPLGVHTLTAEGLQQGGATIRSREVTVNFVSAEQGWQTVRRVLVPLVLLIVVFTVLGAGLTMLTGRKKNAFELGVYGHAGGAVCPRCRMPYPRHVFAMNLLVGKFERCPHCGKWAVVPAASRRELDSAEDRYRDDQTDGRIATDEDQDELRRLIDESRFES